MCLFTKLFLHLFFIVFFFIIALPLILTKVYVIINSFQQLFYEHTSASAERSRTG